MTMFSAIASPGRRWKIFLPDAASMSTTAASALVRSRWSSVRTAHELPALAAARGKLRQADIDTNV